MNTETLEICNRLDKIIALLKEQQEHHWYCGCGHWNGANLAACGACGRKVNGEHS